MSIKDIKAKFKRKPNPEKEFFNELLETIRTQTKAIKAEESEIADLNKKIARLEDKTDDDNKNLLKFLTEKRSTLEASLQRKSVDLGRNLTALNSLKQERIDRKKNIVSMFNGIIPAIIGGITTLTATWIYLKIEHEDMVSGVTAKEIIRVITQGLGRNRRQ